jgi:hypothetical protein
MSEIESMWKCPVCGDLIYAKKGIPPPAGCYSVVCQGEDPKINSLGKDWKEYILMPYDRYLIMWANRIKRKNNA